MIKVGGKVEVTDVPEGFDLGGLKVGSVGRVVSLRGNNTEAAVLFEGLPTLAAFIDRVEYLKYVERGLRDIFLVEEVKDGVEENLPWFKTSKGIEWLYKNFTEAPKELQTYRHGQVFTVNGHDTPYMLVSCLEEGHHTLVNLRTGLQFSLLPYTEEVTYSNVYEMFGGLNFSLVADSVEEYYKVRFNV